MLQSTEVNVNLPRNKSAILIRLAAKVIPKPLHYLPLQLTSDKLEENSLYHYAIFSGNVLATFVVVHSTVLQAKEADKHVFHMVTDKLN